MNLSLIEETRCQYNNQLIWIAR